MSQLVPTGKNFPYVSISSMGAKLAVGLIQFQVGGVFLLS